MSCDVAREGRRERILIWKLFLFQKIGWDFFLGERVFCLVLL